MNHSKKRKAVQLIKAVGDDDKNLSEFDKNLLISLFTTEADIFKSEKLDCINAKNEHKKMCDVVSGLVSKLPASISINPTPLEINTHQKCEIWNKLISIEILYNACILVMKASLLNTVDIDFIKKILDTTGCTKHANQGALDSDDCNSLSIKNKIVLLKVTNNKLVELVCAISNN